MPVLARKKGLKKINEVAQKIAKEYLPQKIVLFGSYAWGKPTCDSDFDLLIIKKNKKNFLTEQQKVRKIIDGEVAVDILIYTPQELNGRLNIGDFFFKNIINKGISLYEE